MAQTPYRNTDDDRKTRGSGRCDCGVLDPPS